MKLKMLRTSLIVLAALVAGGLLFKPCHAGMTPIQALSLSAGVQGRWLDTPQLSAQPDFEAAGNAAITLTPHIDVTGGVAIGFGGSYIREQMDARYSLSDQGSGFSIWLGGGYYWSEEFDDGLKGWAAKGGVGWQPDPNLPIIGGLTAAGTPDNGRSSLTLSVVYLLKRGGE